MKTAALCPQEAESAQERTRPGEEPLRLLLLTDHAGELPWVVKAIVREMSPVELVEVATLGNAIWRLGRERFDSVLLHLSDGDPRAVGICRRQISDLAAVPIVDLRDGDAPPAGASESQLVASG